MGERVVARGGSVKTLFPFEGDAIPTDCDDFDALVIPGGAMSVSDEKHATVFNPMGELVRSFHAGGRPILGLCLGAQVVAYAFGKPVYRCHELQFGFKRLDAQPAARQDPLLGDVDFPVFVFNWHEDTFDLPDDAVHLMHADAVTNHTYRLGDSTYGFQCHFEVTRPMLKSWLQRGGHLVEKNLGEKGRLQFEVIGEAMERHLDGAMRFAHHISERWVELVKSRCRR